MGAIEKEWQSLWDTYRKTPEQIEGRHAQDKYANVLAIANRLLRERLPYQVLSRLAASCETLPANAKKRSDFENTVIEFMVEMFVASGDRENLLKVLSTRGTQAMGRLVSRRRLMRYGPTVP